MFIRRMDSFDTHMIRVGLQKTMQITTPESTPAPPKSPSTRTQGEHLLDTVEALADQLRESQNTQIAQWRAAGGRARSVHCAGMRMIVGKCHQEISKAV